MRCQSCDKILSDTESTHRVKGLYTDTCFACLGIEERSPSIRNCYDDALERELNEAGFQIFSPEVDD